MKNISYIKEGNIALKNGNYDLAVMLYEKALLATPLLSPTIQFNLDYANRCLGKKQNKSSFSQLFDLQSKINDLSNLVTVIDREKINAISFYKKQINYYIPEIEFLLIEIYLLQNNFKHLLDSKDVSDSDLLKSFHNVQSNVFKLLVERTYLNVLKRYPDPAGMENWLSFLNGNGHFPDMLAEFKSSQEAISKGYGVSLDVTGNSLERLTMNAALLLNQEEHDLLEKGN